MSTYNEAYLPDAMDNLGGAFDYVANDCNIDKDKFYDLFVQTGVADQFQIGNCRVVAGMSGAELVMEVLSKCNYPISFPKPGVRFTPTRDYWCGWILAYYQWRTGRSFRDIHKRISMSDLEKLYNPFHEADEEKFVDFMECDTL